MSFLKALHNEYHTHLFFQKYHVLQQLYTHISLRRFHHLLQHFHLLLQPVFVQFLLLLEILLFLYVFLFLILFHDKYDILFQEFFLFHDICHIPVFRLSYQTMFSVALLHVLNHYIYHMFSYCVLAQLHFHDKFYIVHLFYILILFLYQKPLPQELMLSCISNHPLDALLVLDFDFFHQKNFQKYLLNPQNQIHQHLRQSLQSLVHQSHLLQFPHFQMQHVHIDHKLPFFAGHSIFHLLPVLP